MSLANLQNFALNILKETKHDAVQNIEVTELPPSVDPVITERRFSESSQSSGTSVIADMLGDNLGLYSPKNESPLFEHKKNIL
ncbi:hypothetical protein C2G38_2229893 [Gigaspora rosea]|uniref:Uncharacterized protein n=1 Tax=Gigaspora rosea TaxID=44941 RepID=A0A397TXV7_9GLOM|nr:hypothetical protein C2G38_2229893 [Gigaspora rosea]